MAMLIDTQVHSPVIWLWLALTLLLGLWAAVHALFHKQDPRSALGWVALCVFFPLLGALVYWVFGKNRVQRNARRLRQRSPCGEEGESLCRAYRHNTAVPAYLQSLDRLGYQLSRRHLESAGDVTLLTTGEQAYRRMLTAIEQAETQILLATYIFDVVGVGKRFLTALTAARQRGVAVHVLVDGVGEWYSWPRPVARLRRAGIAAARFHAPRLLLPSGTLNLRNHRKILVVDNRVGFTGGMNIRRGYWPEDGAPPELDDLHFCLEGPVVAQLAELFCEDWRLSTHEDLLPAPGPDWADTSLPRRPARVIEDGPDENLDKLTRLILGAVHAAESRIAIMTPYFLPERELVMALQNAVLRGVRVEVVLPARNNLPFVGWAMQHLLPPLMETGVAVYAFPERFLHSKLLVVDGRYLQLGSHNLDPRSLRLNFELGMEVYSDSLSEEALRYFEAQKTVSVPLRLETLVSLPWWARFRNALAWLFSPYL